MPNFICTTCGTQHANSEQPPAACAVCEDDRQYLKVTGQQWTTHDKLRLTNRNSIRFEESGLTGSRAVSAGDPGTVIPSRSSSQEMNQWQLHSSGAITLSGIQKRDWSEEQSKRK